MSSDKIKFLLYGIFLHLTLFYSIFDIYYISPIVKGCEPQPITNHRGLASRVVLFSADGLRADTFFQNHDKSPFLHNLIHNNKASWGISSSHVPTESRPGHVAILAGFYEDVSAITRGWKVNPVSFDSIFNRSRQSWSWGSPDIVPIFTIGINSANFQVYGSELEDFASADAAELDRWVFNKVEDLILNATSSSTSSSLRNRLKLDRTIYFLHLLGLDTNGHGYKPDSKQYIDNIEVVDNGIKRIVHLFESYFNDSSTAYILTSDHGMTDWGSHGAGMDSEILTPFVFWGSGIQPSPIKTVIDQIDITVLMSSLLGIPIPTNSIGILPLKILNATSKYKFQSSYANFNQILQQFLLKRAEKKARTLSLFFNEYYPLRPRILSQIEELIKNLALAKRFETAAQTCLKWIPTLRAGLIYFHRYDRFILGCAICVTFISWILFVSILASKDDVIFFNDVFNPSWRTVYLLFPVALLLIIKSFTITHLFYIILPLININAILNICSKCAYEFLPSTFEFNKSTDKQYTERLSYTIQLLIPIFVFVILQALLLLAFIDRSLLSILLLLICFVPFVSKFEDDSSVIFWKRSWIVCCIILAIYPHFEPVGKTYYPFICILSSTLFCVFLHQISTNYFYFKNCRGHFRLHSFLHGIVATLLFYINYVYKDKAVPMLIRLLSWCLSIFAMFMPMFSSSELDIKLYSWFSSLYLPYSLMSLSYESSFFLLYLILLITYLQLELKSVHDFKCFSVQQLNSINSSYKAPGSKLLWNCKQSFMFIILIEVAFFGTGNIASINSFNPAFLRCFLTVFSPFKMASLLIAKISIPFFAVALVFAVLLKNKQANDVTKLSIFVLIISDTMALIFFFRLVEDGSWLEIGTSISHYVISMAMSAITFLLLHMALSTLSLPLDGFVKKKKKRLFHKYFDKNNKV